MIDDTESGMIFMDALNFCGCGRPERVAELLAAYLSALVEDSRQAEARCVPTWKQQPWLEVGGDDRDVFLMCAYIADAAGWTEHGGSVHGAWITESGRDILAKYLKAHRSQIPA